MRQNYKTALFLFFFTVNCCLAAPPGDAPAWDGAEEVAHLSIEQAVTLRNYASTLVGIPYRYGGSTPISGFDCSGLIKHVYSVSAGISVPRTVALLVKWGKPVEADAARMGDLILFVRRGSAKHAGIYIGDGKFIHAPSRGKHVRIDRLSSKYWSKQKSAFIRP